MIISSIKPLDWQLYFLIVISHTVPIGAPLYFSLKFTDKSACVGKQKKLQLLSQL